MKKKIIKIPAPNAFGNFPVWFVSKGSKVIAQTKNSFFDKIHKKKKV